MSKVEVVCPHCDKPNAVEKSIFADRHGLQKIQCSHCSKSWAEDLSVTGTLAKSAHAPSSELAELRVEINAQFTALLAKLNGIIERRATAARRFNTSGVERSDVTLHELQKALANGTPITFQSADSTPLRFQTAESVGSGRRVRSGQPFDTNGVEKSDVADAELQRALDSGKPVGFTPRGN